MLKYATIIGSLIVMAGLTRYWFMPPKEVTEKRFRVLRRDIRGWLGLEDVGVGLMGRLKRLAIFVVLLCLILLTFTGFLPVLGGEILSGYLLILHVTLAPVFIVAAAFAIVTWAYQSRFNEKDLQTIRANGSARSESSDFGWKLCFWISACLSIPVSLSIVLGMFPLFGTHAQHTLLTVHQYTSLLLVWTAIILFYLLVQSRGKATAMAPVVKKKSVPKTIAPAKSTKAKTRATAQNSTSRKRVSRKSVSKKSPTAVPSTRRPVSRKKTAH